MPFPNLLANRRLVELIIRFLTVDEPAFRKIPLRWRSIGGRRRYGRGPIEIVVVVGIAVFALMIVLVSLPKGRESARMLKCQQNLMQVGVGLQMYHQAQAHYPTVPRLENPIGSSPIQALFEAFVVPDLIEMRDPSKPPKPSRMPPRGARVPGLACPSDSNAFGGLSSPFNSYRANTGDSPSGFGGPFEPGRMMTSGEIERGDGLSFTAGYAERLVGDGRDKISAIRNYGITPGPITTLKCPEIPEDRWKGDAGSDWSGATWRSTLYQHTLSPNAPRSCIADDGLSALMGPSSSHPDRINLLMMDGSVKGVTPTIDPKVWQAMGTVDSTGGRSQAP